MRKVMQGAAWGMAAFSVAIATPASQAALLPIASQAVHDAVDPGNYPAPARYYGKRRYHDPHAYHDPYAYNPYAYGGHYGYGSVSPQQRYNIWVYRENQRWHEQQFREQNPGAIYVPGQRATGFDPR
jgi:hypothetical protein